MGKPLPLAKAHFSLAFEASGDYVRVSKCRTLVVRPITIAKKARPHGGLLAFQGFVSSILPPVLVS